MSWEYDPRDDYEPETVSRDLARYHLATVGDAIEARVKRCLAEALRLHDQGFYGPSVVASATAIELTIRFLLLRPLVSGAFLSDEWESIIAERIGEGRTEEDRRLLPDVLRQWKLDIKAVKLRDGQKLWAALTRQPAGILTRRNHIVHRGDEGTKSEARLAMESAQVLLKEVVYPISKMLDFTLDTTGLWCFSKRGEWSESRTHPWDPIEKKPFSVMINGVRFPTKDSTGRK